MSARDLPSDGITGTDARRLTGAIPRQLAISRFPQPATTSTRPTLYQPSWPELVTMLSVHERWADKDGWGWSPATYSSGRTRANKNVYAVSCFVADRDHETFDDLEATVARLGALGLAFVIYSTFSNDPPNDVRYRVAIPFDKPVTGDEGGTTALARWRLVWGRTTYHVLGGKNDKQTKDLSRMFYPPSAPPDAAVFVKVGEGLALNWEALPPSPTAGSTTTRDSDGEVQHRGSIARIGREALDFIAMGAPIGEQRGRALAAGRNLLAAGLSIEQATDKLVQGFQNCEQDPDDPWTENHALQIVTSLANSEPTPPRELEEPIDLWEAIKPATPPAAYRINGHAGGNGKVHESGEPVPRRRFRLLTDTEVEAMEPPECRIEGILPKGGTTVLYGASGVGKSFLAIDMGASVASGLPFHGKAVQPCPVVYIAAEGVGGMGVRLRAWKQARGIGGSIPLHFVAGAVSLMDEAEVVDLAAGLAPLHPGEIIIDTLARSMGGGDENSTRDMSRAVANVDLLRTALGCGVTLVHHTGHDESRERGSSALRAAADAKLALSGDPEDLTLDVEKLRDWGRGASHRFSLDVVALGDGITSCVLISGTRSTRGVTGKTLQALEVLARDFGQEGATASDWKKACTAVGIKGQNFFRLRRRLERETCVGGGGERGAKYKMTPTGRRVLAASGSAAFDASDRCHGTEEGTTPTNGPATKDSGPEVSSVSPGVIEKNATESAPENVRCHGVTPLYKGDTMTPNSGGPANEPDTPRPKADALALAERLGWPEYRDEKHHVPAGEAAWRQLATYAPLTLGKLADPLRALEFERLFGVSATEPSVADVPARLATTNPDPTRRRCDRCGGPTRNEDSAVCARYRLQRSVLELPGRAETITTGAASGTTPRVACLHCGATFEPTRTRYVYCSDACRDEDIPE